MVCVNSTEVTEYAHSTGFDLGVNSGTHLRPIKSNGLFHKKPVEHLRVSIRLNHGLIGSHPCNYLSLSQLLLVCTHNIVSVLSCFDSVSCLLIDCQFCDKAR